MRIVALWLAVLGVGCTTEVTKEQFYDRGEQYLAAGHLPEAIIEFRNAVNRDERWGPARFKLAEAYAAHAEPDLAYRQYIRAADLLPDDVKVQLKAAAYLLLAGQYDDAQARAEHVLRKDPSSVEAQVALGSALAGLRDLDSAVSVITDAIRLDPNRSPSYMALARIRVAQGKLDEAAVAFDRAVTSDGRSIVAHLARANFQWSTGKVAQAEASLKRVLDIDSENVLTRRVLASVYLDSGRSAEAEPHLRFVAEYTKTVPSRLSLADYYLLVKQYDKARQVLLPLTADRDSRGAAETRLANMLYAEGQRAEGRELLAAVLAREPTNDAAQTLTARWLLDDGRPLEALEHLRSALSANPQLVPALYLKAAAEARAHRTPDASKTLLEILKLNPRDAEAQAQLSAIHLARNQIDSAVHLAGEALANAPGQPGPRLALARALVARGDVKGAAAEIAAARAQSPDAPDSYIVEGALRIRTGDARRARTAFEQAVQRDSRSREALEGLLMLDVAARNPQGAWTRIAPHLATFDREPKMLRLAGEIALALKDVARAEGLLGRSVALDPLEIDSVTLLVRLLTEERRLEPALARFDEEAAREPGNVAARLVAAVIAHTQGKVAEATVRYLHVLTLEPRAVLAANNLAAIYVSTKTNLTQAQHLAELAVEHQPTHPSLRDTLGTVYLERQLLGPAIVQFQESVANAPGNPVYHYHLGLAQARSGAIERARESFQRAVQLNPRLGAARQALTELP